MAITRRERFLIAVVLLSGFSLVGSLVSQRIYQAWASIDEEIEAQHLYLSQLQAVCQRKAGIEEKYLRAQSQLTMNMSQSAQIAQFNQELQNLIKTAGMQVVGQIKPQEKPRLEEDFKVLLIDVSQARGTPQQLGTFLHNLENTSDVTDVEELTITNEAVGRSRLSGAGLLTMDMLVARLVEYATGEKPQIRRGRTRLGR